MATITKTFTENVYPSNKSTWTVSITGTNQTVSGSSFILTMPTLKAKYVGSKKGYAYVDLLVRVNNISGRILSPISYFNQGDSGPIKWASGSEKTVAGYSANPLAIPTNLLFNADNKTNITANITLRSVPYDIELLSTGADWEYENSYGNGLATSDYIWGVISTITLDAPPTFIATTTSSGEYFGTLTPYEVNVSNATAQYEGDIVSSSLTIGAQTVTGTGNGTLSLTPANAGTFTPMVSVTDSRGQVTTKTLDAITVEQYDAPEVSFTAERTLQSGAPDDEGAYAVLTAQFEYTDAVATLVEPTVEVDGTTHTATWYSTRASDGTLSGVVDWNNTSPFSSPKTLYGLLGTFQTEQSYVISVTPSDNYHSGLEISQTLATAFYTVDFLAGGHGIAFGEPAKEQNFSVNMDAVFKRQFHPLSLVGAVQMFAGATAPTGWLICDGSEKLIDDYPLLYDVIGNTYGTASDADHFVLPDLQSRFPIGVDLSYPLGDTGGSADAIVPYHRHSVSAVPNAITGGSHNHEIKYNTVSRTAGGSNTRVGPYSYTNTGYDGVFNKPNDHTHNLPAHNTNYEGTDGEEVGANIPPYLGLNFIIYAGV